jgi:hypothetical protein
MTDKANLCISKLDWLRVFLIIAVFMVKLLALLRSSFIVIIYHPQRILARLYIFYPAQSG